ncbi:E3 ubiquitin-protein ligase XB3 isoform X2 [Brachypodium distachyon]|uniref:E3 ubiquitin-protein ligase XB3 isoform X2 n=1 Tax=Brachypodium distachyon TaxID=15368 RepID=UPI00052FF18B|nr:E3 ubiquitin-protein ligase XB3 isoform X2 [Brachypodium distachyon]|eukprot:XP_010228799.1 E3 ubiquitin-protein ligase XB3 isoform X2 [Brachypodium distachyon]
MGHGASCGRPSEEVDFFGAAQSGDLARLAAAVRSRPSLLRRTTLFDRLSALHIAAAHGHLQVVSMALDLCVQPDVVNRHKQTALMLAAMHGRTECVRRLLDAGANILMFDSSHGRTCLHYAAYYGHSDCLRTILSAARTAPVSQSWGYARFVNVRDDTGATPLHLAARQGWRRCVHVLLENGAIVSASSGAFGFPGSTPLHLAARGGSLDCVRQLLSWGADRLQRDSVGRIPYEVAMKRGHAACAALLNPASAEPLVWPSPLKFISELEPDAKALLEAALMEANREREKRVLKGTKSLLPSPSHSDDGATISEDAVQGAAEVCSICFEQACSIEVRDCGHQMCAACTLALCCHTKPNPATQSQQLPTCPFCRGSISRLAVATKAKAGDDEDDDDDDDVEGEDRLEESPRHRRTRRSMNLSGDGGSSSGSLMGSIASSIGKMGRRKTDSSEQVVDDKP